MKIAFDVTALYVAQGGIFYYDYNLARALLEHAAEHELLFIDYYPIHGGWIDPPELRMLEDAEILRHVKGLRHRKLSRLHFLQHSTLFPVAKWIDRTLFKPWALAADWVQEHRLAPMLEGVDVFHSSEVLLWKQPDALNVTTIYDLSALLFPEYHTDQTREIQAKKYRFAYEEADIVIAISKATKRDIVEHLGIPAERIHVVYPGCEDIFRPIQDRGELQTMLAPLGLTPGDYLLYVGTLEPRKNLLRLVEAYHRARHNLSVPIPKLILAGAPGWDFRRIFELIEVLDLEDDVRYVGRVSRTTLPFLYSGARLFVYPSLYEGFGLPPLEAMACGTPVITSNVSSLPEVVGEAGLMVAPTDIEALAQAIVELLSDSYRSDCLRDAGLFRSQFFSWKRSLIKLLNTYNTLLSAKLTLS